MAYKKEEMIKQSLEAIETNDLVFIEEIMSFVPFSKATFYNHNLDKLDDITKALGDKKIQIKSRLRKTWAESRSPILQIALYKLLASNEEYQKLIQQKIDHTSKGDSMQPINISVTTAETADQIKKLLGEND